MSKVSYWPEIWGGTLPASSITLHSTAFSVGSGDYIAFVTGSQQERLRIDSSGFSSFGGFSNTTIDGSNSTIQVVNDNSVGWPFSTIAIGNNAFGGGFVFAKTRATSPGTQTAVHDNDVIGAIWSAGSDGSSEYKPSTGIQWEVDGSVSGSTVPISMVFYSGHWDYGVEAMRIDSNQLVTIGTGTSVLAGGEEPLLVSVLHGSVGTPVTARQPTLAASRREAITADATGGQNAAIYASVHADNTSVAGSNPQTNALTGKAVQDGDGDAVGVYSSATMNTAGYRAFGGFCNADAAVTHAKATGLEISVTSNNGFDNSVTDGSYSTVGINIEVGGANTGFAGISFANDAGGQWASGIYFSTACIKTALIYAAAGTVVNGIDFSAATISGYVLKSPAGSNINGTGKIEGFATPASRTVSGTTDSLAATDSSVIFSSGSTKTWTLQSAATYAGRWIYVKNTGAGALNSAASDVVPLGGSAAGTAILSANAGRWAALQSDGTNWIIMAGVI